MKTAIQLTPNLRYMSLNDEEGVFGLFILHLNNEVIRTIEVYNEDEFKNVYNELTTEYAVV